MIPEKDLTCSSIKFNFYLVKLKCNSIIYPVFLKIAMLLNFWVLSELSEQRLVFVPLYFAFSIGRSGHADAL